MEEQPDIYNSDICKPQQVRNNKIFTERNVIIQRGVNDMKMCGDGLLEMTKPWKIDCKIR